MRAQTLQPAQAVRVTDAKEIARLERKHKDIALLGAAALQGQIDKERRQAEMQEFVLSHRLACFKCGSMFNAWAKTGTSNGRQWAICVRCVREKP